VLRVNVGSQAPTERTGLLVFLDGAGGRHYGYGTARRTLCLDVLIDSCSEGHEAAGTACPACEGVRRRLNRRRREWHELGVETRALVQA
jgi:hypothetical protein